MHQTKSESNIYDINDDETEIRAFCRFYSTFPSFSLPLRTRGIEYKNKGE